MELVMDHRARNGGSKTRLGSIAVLILSSSVAFLSSRQHTAAESFEQDILGQHTCDHKRPPGTGGQGVIVEFLSSEQAMRLIARTQARVHSTIDPRYIENRRVVLSLADGRRMVALLPESMFAKPGDRVAYAAGHPNSVVSCSYIPNLVTRLIPPPGEGRH